MECLSHFLVFSMYLLRKYHLNCAHATMKLKIIHKGEIDNFSFIVCLTVYVST